MIHERPFTALALALFSAVAACNTYEPPPPSGGAGGSGPEGGGGSGGDGGNPAACDPGETRSCYSGPAATKGVGDCAPGIQTCTDQGVFGPCEGQVLPAEESCALPGDEDCDGVANEPEAGCVCSPGEKMPCYDGPAGTEGVGACAGGFRTCTDGTGFGACEGQVVPATELCSNAIDDDCNAYACGEVVWAKPFSAPNPVSAEEYIELIRAGAPGEFFAFVDRAPNAPSFANPDLVLKKYDASGALLWENVMKVTGTGSFADASYDPVKGLTILGYLEKNGTLLTASGQAVAAGGTAGATFRLTVSDGGLEGAATIFHEQVLGVDYTTACTNVFGTGMSEVHACRIKGVGSPMFYVTPAGTNPSTVFLANQLMATAAQVGTGYVVAGTFTGNLNLGAFTYCPNPGTFDWFVAKLDQDFGLDWIQCFGTDLDDPEIPLLAVTTDDRIVLGLDIKAPLTVGGTTIIPQGYKDALLVALADDGSPVWTTALSGPGNQYVAALEADDAGGVLGAFYSSDDASLAGSSVQPGFSLVQLTAAASISWVRSYDSGGDSGNTFDHLEVLPGEPAFLLGGLVYTPFTLAPFPLAPNAPEGSPFLAKIGR